MTLHERINHFTPKIKNVFVHAWYQFLAAMPYDEELLFMNYGFVPQGGSSLALEPADEPYRRCIELYAHTAAGAHLAGKQVLEVGCGRGGGASYLARYLKPAHLTGLDYAARAVRKCRQRHRLPNISFIQGSALALPFTSASFDAVVNVESSHTYLSFPQFASEVCRVLKPAGLFLFTDLRDTDKAAPVKSDLEKAGFTILEEEHIEAAVLRAMEADHERKCRQIEARTPFFLHTTMRQFAGTRESFVYRGLADGSVQYLRYKAQKPAQS